MHSQTASTLPVQAFLLLMLVASVAQAQSGAGPIQEFRHENVLGTSMSLRVGLEDSGRAREVEAHVLDELERLQRLLTRHEEGSPMRDVIDRATPVEVEPELFDVFAAARDWWRRSGGAFDPIAVSRSASPDAAETGVGFELDEMARTVRCAEPGTVDLDGLAKGFVIDRVLASIVARFPEFGPDSQLRLELEIGGDLRALGAVPMRVGLVDPRDPSDNADPLTTVKVVGCAVASSGGYAGRTRSDGGNGSHLIDPSTGSSVSSVLGSSVIARSCLQADALATILCVLPPSEGLDLVESLPDTEAIVVTADGIVHRSSRLLELIDPTSTSPFIEGAGTRKISAARQEVVLSFTLRAPDRSQKGGRRSYRRPYVAAWVEDFDTREPVRTLCLWMDRDRWLRDLRTWYRLHRRNRKLIDSVSRATRRPGEYELVWNGRSDSGEALAVGEYSICLEIAREHGTHQLVRIPVQLGASGSVTRLAPNPELAGGMVVVRKR